MNASACLCRRHPCTCGAAPACYGDTMPRWMLPEHHPEHTAVPRTARGFTDLTRAKARQLYRTATASRRLTWKEVETHAAKLPRAKTWSGDYPDAPPAPGRVEHAPRDARLWVRKGQLMLWPEQYRTPNYCVRRLDKRHTP